MGLFSRKKEEKSELSSEISELKLEEINRISSLPEETRNSELNRLSPKQRDEVFTAVYGFNSEELGQFYEVLGKPEYESFIDKWLEKRFLEISSIIEKDGRLEHLRGKLLEAFINEKLREKLLNDSDYANQKQNTQKDFDNATKKRWEIEMEYEDILIKVIKPHLTLLERWKIENIGKEKLRGDNTSVGNIMIIIEGQKTELKNHLLNNLPADIPKSNQVQDMLKADEKVLFTIPEVKLIVHNLKEEDEQTNQLHPNYDPNRPVTHGYKRYADWYLVVTNKRLFFSETKSKDKVVDFFVFDEQERMFFWIQTVYWHMVYGIKHRDLKGFGSLVGDYYKMWGKGFVKGINNPSILPNYAGFITNPAFATKEKKKGLLGRGGMEIASAGIHFVTVEGVMGGRECDIGCEKEYVSDMEQIFKVVANQPLRMN